MYLVLEVPNRSGIRIHAGNWAGDESKGYKSDFLGCIGLGRKLLIKNEQFMVTSSRVTIAKLERILDYQDFQLTITEEGYNYGLRQA